MTYIPDLSTWDYWYEGGSEHADPRLIAVGWLGEGNPFATGPLLARIEDMLGRLLTSWQPFMSLGHHVCDICTPELAAGHAHDRRGSGELFVPGRGRMYVAPVMIKHYVRHHGYAPPEEFVEAVCGGPAIGAREYFRAMIDIGGPRHLIEAAEQGLKEVEARLARARGKKS